MVFRVTILHYIKERTFVNRKLINEELVKCMNGRFFQVILTVIKVDPYAKYVIFMQFVLNMNISRNINAPLANKRG